MNTQEHISDNEGCNCDDKGKGQYHLPTCNKGYYVEPSSYSKRLARERWIFVKAFKNGHKFYLNVDGRMGVADQSGHYPHETDDGTLWLDETRPIDVEGRYIGLPLTYPNGEQTRTPISVSEAQYCISQFRMKVRIGSVVLSEVK